MLIVFQIPFADLRDFIPNTSRLEKPSWIDPKVDFIHRFGVIEKCSNKKRYWTNEALHCKASRVFRFNNKDIEELAKHEHGMVVLGRRLYAIEVRELDKNKETDLPIYYTNKTIGCLEVGFLHANKKKLIQSSMSSSELDSMIRKCLDLRIDIMVPGKELKRDEPRLLNIKDYLSHIYLYATTKRSAISNMNNWWISCGNPMLIVEYSTSEMSKPLKNAELVYDLEKHHIRIFFKDFKISPNFSIKTWYIETTKKTDPSKTRSLVEGLLHISKSQQCLTKVIDNKDKLKISENAECNDIFQRYLEFTFASLFRRERFGFPCKEFASILKECEDVVSEPERKHIIAKFSDLGIRGNYLRNLDEFIKMAKGKKENIKLKEKVDVLLLTAVKDEFDVIYKMDPGWIRKEDNKGYYYYTKQIYNNSQQLITIALARAISMGGSHTANLATRLSSLLNPTCLAMVGICAGWRNRVNLGDIIIADRVFKYDNGKIIDFADGNLGESNFFNDIQTYNLNPIWKQRAEDFSSDWQSNIKSNRPIEYCYQEYWLLNALYEFSKEGGVTPINHCDRKALCPDYENVIQSLEKKGLISIKDFCVTDQGIDAIITYRNIHPDGSPKCSNQSKVFVKPIASGDCVVQNPDIFRKISSKVRSVLGIEMEGAAIGEVAELEQLTNFIVIKAVSDYADEEKADYFREYSIEAAYRFLIDFLKENLVV